MSTTNEVWIPVAGHLQRLDLDDETILLANFVANDRAKPDTLQSVFTAEFSAPGTARNHRLLGHAAAASTAGGGAAYQRLSAVLTSGGVETLPLALLYVKGYEDGRYLLQLFGGNLRFVEQLRNPDGTDKMLSDLDLSRFDHAWTPANILTGLPFAHWQDHGWGYELFDRGKGIDLQAVDPYTLFPSVAGRLVWEQLLAGAGFTADTLQEEPLFAALNVPSANPYEFPDKFREARALQAGFEYFPAGNTSDGRISDGQFHEAEFAPERLPFLFTGEAPYRAPTTGATYSGETYVVDTLGYHTLSVPVVARFGSRRDIIGFGQVSCKVMLYVNGQPVYVNGQQQGVDSLRITSGPDYVTHTFAPKLERYLLQPGDTVDVYWQGDEWDNGVTGAGPLDPYWQIGLWGNTVLLPNGNRLNTETTFSVTLLAEFPPGGLVKLNEWLPEVSQLDFVRSYMLLGGLTIQPEPYTNHLRLAPGYRLLDNIPSALDWTAKRDAATRPGRLPERSLSFRFGDYGQRNEVEWKPDQDVRPGYGNGQLAVVDRTLPGLVTVATLPFAATEASTTTDRLLRIRNYERTDFTSNPINYNVVEAQPRLVLRREAPQLVGQLITAPAYTDGSNVQHPAVLAAFTTSASYFAGIGLSLDLNATVLTRYWADLRAMLDETRYLTERYRLSAADIAALDFSIPIYDALLGDYFALSRVGEFDARRPTEVVLVRLNAAHLPTPNLPDGALVEWYAPEWYRAEWY